MSLTVVISSYNQLLTLPVAIASMRCQDRPPERVIVADDGSCDGTREWLDSVSGDFPFELGYVTHEHDGYGLTVIENLAISLVEGERVMFTNADVVHHPGSVQAHMEISDGRMAGGLIREIGSPGSLMVGQTDIDDFGRVERIFVNNRGKVTNEGYFKCNPELNWYGIWGGNFSVGISELLEVGGFNEEYKGLYGGEEADLIQRLKRIGCNPTWVYNSVCYHLAHKSRIYGSEALGNRKYRKEYL